MHSVTQEILQQLRGALLYHSVSGIERYPRSQEIETFLRSRPMSPGVVVQAERQQAAALVGEVSVRPHGTIDEIAVEICSCRSCDLAERRIVAVPGTGTGAIKLLVVGSWLMTDKATGIGDVVFGIEEDQMLHKMLQAIHLSAEDAFVTNIVKCGIGQGIQPTAQHIMTCSSYLERQIAATSPEVICTMGIEATRVLLHLNKPLSQLRGRLYPYRLEHDRTIPLIPTYHPSFLLRNPEMKRATWEDLQLVEKQLRH